MKKLVSIGYVERRNADVIPTNTLDKVVFAPNPLTGLPDNDQVLIRDGKLDANLVHALDARNRVMQDDAIGSFDDDAVLDTLQYNNESDEDYSLRMREYVNEQSKKLKE